MGDIFIENGSVLRLREDSRLTLTEDSKLTIRSIDNVKNIEPVAVHLKELNHIDPLSIDALHVSEVKNIEPLQIAKFNVTNLPMVNMSLQKLPDVGINVRTLPPVSVGVHQDFCVPSDYILHARLLGIEIMRLRLHGQTSILPREHARREQAHADHKSYPTPAVAGNPAIPSHCSTQAEHPCCPPPACAGQPHGPATHALTPLVVNASGPVAYPADATAASLSFGAPRASFQLPDRQAAGHYSENRVMSGE